tara:strand:+ start:1108 stop:1281 length:174 start_codon:yes stop_codon:yes gene_type:complete
MIHFVPGAQLLVAFAAFPVLERSHVLLFRFAHASLGGLATGFVEGLDRTGWIIAALR